MNISYKYRLQPTEAQVDVLEEQLRICRCAYNTLLGYCITQRKAGKGTPTQYNLQNLLPTMKTQTPELTTVFSQVLQNICKRIRRGFENYWARLNHGLKASVPHFKDRHHYRSITYPQSGFSLRDGWLKLSKIGTLKLSQHRPIEGKVKTLTIKRTPTGKWYATFSVEVETKPIPNREKAVGVDFGLIHLVALSDGTTYEAPKTYRHIEAQVRRASKALSEKKRGSKNRNKARVRLGRVYEKATNRRRDFAYKVARSIVNRYEIVVVEDLRIDNMKRNRCLSKSVGDAGWGILRGALTYMAQRSEGVMVLVDPLNTSQTCSGCGSLVPKDLSERVHRCPNCGLELDRDVNASRNILHKGIPLEQRESKPVETQPIPLGSSVWQVESMNQEALPFRAGLAHKSSWPRSSSSCR